MLRFRIKKNITQNISDNNDRFITIPVGLNFTPTDYEEQRDELLRSETDKVINRPIDGETVKYTKNDGLTIRNRFYNIETDKFERDYSVVGFETEDFLKQNFKRSFYRLYFYDGLDDSNNTLLFTEDVKTSNLEPIISIDRFYWFKTDTFFIKNNQDRIVYMGIVFFNAKNGKQYKLIPNNGPSKLPVTIKNPNTNNGNYQFTTEERVVTFKEDVDR